MAPSDSPPPGHRGAGLPVGRYFGVPVYLAPSWLLFAGYIVLLWSPVVRDNVPGLSNGQSYAVAFGFAVLVAVSVLLHELGHCAVSVVLGLRVRRVVLLFLGGISEIENEPERPAHEYLVAVAGPLVSLLLAGIGAAAYPSLPEGSVTRWLVVQLMLSNLGVMLFNMLPGLPLDGGRLLRAGVWSLRGSQLTGTKAAAWGGRAVAVLLVGGSLYLQARVRDAAISGFFVALVLAAFIWINAGQALRAAALRTSLPRLHLADLIRPMLAVPRTVSLGEAIRRARASDATALVVVDGDGAPLAVVSEAAVLAVPEQQRPWTPVTDVARSLEPALTLRDSLSGEALLESMQAHPATEYLVVGRGGEPVGVLVATDVARAFSQLATGQTPVRG